MQHKPKISFIICTYNREVYLQDTLRTLSTSCESLPVEILVVDNNSTDNTEQIVNQWIQKRSQTNLHSRYVKEKKQGLSYARNRGINEATAPVLIFLDDDIIVPSLFVQAWLTFFENHPNAQAAGGKIHIQFDDPRPLWMSSYLLPLLGHHDFGNSIKSYGKTNYPFGGNMAFRADIFNEYGKFNTGLGRIGSDLKASEEKEFFRRLQQDGENIYYVPDAFLFHRVNSSRLTKNYIRRQAIGLGQSIAFQMEHASGVVKISAITKEIGKWAATAALFVFYSLKFQLSKGVTLIQFRYWILKGLFSQTKS